MLTGTMVLIKTRTVLQIPPRLLLHVAHQARVISATVHRAQPKLTAKFYSSQSVLFNLKNFTDYFSKLYESTKVQNPKRMCGLASDGITTNCTVMIILKCNCIVLPISYMHY